jgi:hypothetical protein
VWLFHVECAPRHHEDFSFESHYFQPISPQMKNFASILAWGALAAITLQPVFAGTPVADDKKVLSEPCPPDSSTTITLLSSYVFDSDFHTAEHFSQDATTRGHAFNNEVEVGYRIPLSGLQWPNKECGAWYLRLGADYDRYDFGNRGSLPLPDELQSFCAVVALEYLVKGDVGIILEVRPGFYFENQVTSGAFDIPIKIGTGIPLTKTLSLAIAAEYHGLSRYKFVPDIGLIWQINDQWVLLGTLPEPKLLYHPNEKFQAWAGGEVMYSSFRTDSSSGIYPSNLNHAVVDYSEYRVGAGISYKLCKHATANIAAGYAIRREFDFHSTYAGIYSTDGGAPYMKFQLTTEF